MTEATGVQTFHRMEPRDPVKLVGKALPGYLLAMTEEGEVLVSGKGLARGYLGLPEETARCFVEVPLEEGSQNNGNNVEVPRNAPLRVYRTGDLASWTVSKGLELRGRKDHQVKISGVRVESFEIETAVEASGLVETCTCLVQQQHLVAHCVLRGNLAMDCVLRWKLMQPSAYRRR